MDTRVYYSRLQFYSVLVHETIIATAVRKIDIAQYKITTDPLQWLGIIYKKKYQLIEECKVFKKMCIMNKNIYLRGIDS